MRQAVTPSSSSGFALVTSLLVMVVILLLGVGSMYLTRSNLKVAENVQVSATARGNAEIGLDASLLYLERYLEEHGVLPSAAEFVLPLVQGGSSVQFALADRGEYVGYSVAEVNVDGAQFQRVTLQVEGQGPRSGAYVAELVADVSLGGGGGNEVIPLFGQGVSARRLVTVNGGPTFLDAGLHGNTGYTLNGFKVDAFRRCVERNANGTCRTDRKYSGPPYPVTAAVGERSYTCNINPGNNDICDWGPVQLVADPFIDPETGQPRFDPSYEGPRNAALCAIAYNPNAGCGSARMENLNNLACTVTHSGYPTMNRASDLPGLGFRPGAVVCINGGVNFPSGADLSGVTVVARDSMNFNGESHGLDDTMLVSIRGGVNLNGKQTLRNTRIFSQHSLNMNGKTSMVGTTTIASAGSVTFNGSTGNNDGVSRLAVVAGGDIIFNGSSDTWGGFLAGGDFIQNGKANIYGGVVALGSATFNGKLTIDSGVPIANPDLPSNPGQAGGTIRLISRR